MEIRESGARPTECCSASGAAEWTGGGAASLVGGRVWYGVAGVRRAARAAAGRDRPPGRMPGRRAGAGPRCGGAPRRRLDSQKGNSAVSAIKFPSILGKSKGPSCMQIKKSTMESAYNVFDCPKVMQVLTG
ncbi:hypothetical protein Misp03_23730 [Microbispora sp. NBRC 16548]|nr:hypothetical protein Misp03_23730 [Microbispora sp. NBRC 16548]